MLDSLTAAWNLGREWGRDLFDANPEQRYAKEWLSRAGLPTDVDHIRTFRDGAKDGAAGIKEMSRAPRRWNGRLD